MAMPFCQLGQAQSLREICGGLASCEGKLRHLVLPKAPNRSALAYANAHRPWQLSQDVFGQIYHRCQSLAQPPRRFRFRHPMFIVDCTLIELCASVFDWAAYRKPKGAVKLGRVALDGSKIKANTSKHKAMSYGRMQEMEAQPNPSKSKHGQIYFRRPNRSRPRPVHRECQLLPGLR